MNLCVLNAEIPLKRKDWSIRSISKVDHGGSRCVLLEDGIKIQPSSNKYTYVTERKKLFCSPKKPALWEDYITYSM